MSGFNEKNKYISISLVAIFILFSLTAATIHRLPRKSSAPSALQAQSESSEVEQFPMRPPSECDADIELVIDISGSMSKREVDGRQKLAWVKDAALDFLAEMEFVDDLPDNDIRVGLSTFGMTYSGAYNSGIIRQPVTSTWYLLRNSINSLTTQSSNGFGTCVECGLRAGRADLFSNIIDSTRPKFVIMISDGYGNRTLTSGNTNVGVVAARSAAISEAFLGKRSAVIYFVIGYGEGATFDSLTLTGVANDPDSSYYAYKPNVSDWVDHFRDLAVKVCDRPVTNSCSVASTLYSTPENPVSLTTGVSITVGTNFTNFTPLGKSAEVRYGLTDASVAGITPGTTFTVPNPPGSTAFSYYFSRVNVTSLSTAIPGSTTELKSDVYIDGVLQCTTSTFFKTGSVDPWWQVGGGDVVAARGNVTSDVPTIPAPGKVLMAKDYFGIPIFEGSISPNNRNNLGVPGGNVDTRFVSYLTPSGANYNYDFFARKFISPANINQTLISSATYFDSNLGTGKEGYQVYFRNTDLDFGTLNFTGGQNKKIIIFVNGNVDLTGKIILDDGRDFFMLIAKGSIVVDSSVGDTTAVKPGTAGSADLEGIFVTDNEFNTSGGASTNKQLVVRGTVVGWGNNGGINGINFQRDIGTSNINYAAEIFEFAPDLILNFPGFFGEKTIIWKEVSP